MIIKQQANHAKAAALPVHSVSEFTHSFSFTPSSELYEWTNVGNIEWGYRGRFRIQLLSHTGNWKFNMALHGKELSEDLKQELLLYIKMVV